MEFDKYINQLKTTAKKRFELVAQEEIAPLFEKYNIPQTQEALNDFWQFGIDMYQRGIADFQIGIEQCGTIIERDDE